MRRWIGLAVLLAGLHLAARLALLSADPPATYPGGRVAQELLFEGPAKAHEARRFALTGAATTDDYRVWSVQSPVFVAPLGWFMRLFGPGYASLRVFCGLVGALLLLSFRPAAWWVLVVTGSLGVIHGLTSVPVFLPTFLNLIYVIYLFSIRPLYADTIKVSPVARSR